MKLNVLILTCAVMLAFVFLLSGTASAADACTGALVQVGDNPPALGNATGCGLIINVTAVDDSGKATAFTISTPNGGNGNPYDSPPFASEGDSSDDTLVGIQNNSGHGLTSITLTSTNTTFGGAFNFDHDGPCDFASFQYNSNQDCFDRQFGYEGPDNFFSGNCDGELGLPCPTTGTVNFTEEGGLEDGSNSWFALEGTPASLNLAQQAVLTFTPGQPFAVGTFNCASGLVPCPDQGAHSMKFTLNSVSSTFSIILVATEVDGDGVCESGVPGDPSDPIDCRFVRYFGEPAFNNTGQTNIHVPLCYAYSSSTPGGTNHCVFYSVQGAPPPPGQSGSPYTAPVIEAIAWNTLETPPAGYVNSPRMYDDPSDDLNTCNCYPTIMAGMFDSFPYSLNAVGFQSEDDQFVFDITAFFNPNPGFVGKDPVTTSKGQKSFNDFVIGFPLTLAQVQQPINLDGSSVFNANRGVVPIKFTLMQDGVSTCNLQPAAITLDRLFGGTPGSVDEGMYSMAADSGPNFRVSGCQYIYNLAAANVGPGQYKVGVMINSEIVGTAYFELK